jgi:hypothetical protein
MRDRYDFDGQFRETGGERAARWRKIKKERKAAGKCCLCAKPIAECKPAGWRTADTERRAKTLLNLLPRARRLVADLPDRTGPIPS